jgi:hypothetical protein
LATIQKKKQQVLTAVDYEILRFVHQYHFLTVSQVTRLRYSAGSETTCQDRLKRLFDAGYLSRRKLPHVGTGNTDYLYYLSTRGQKELQAIGETSFTRVRKDDIENLKLPHLEHLLALNDFLIAGRLLARSVPDITLVAMRHDLDLKKTPLKISMPRGERITLVPDGFLDFRLSIAGKSYAMPIWVELDRGTEWSRPLQSKLRAIITAIHTQAYEDLFGVSSITVAFATTGEKRCDLMRSFVQQELTHMGLTHLTNLFLFAALPYTSDPQTLFLSPLWYTPDNNAPVPLLDLSEE